MKEMWEKPSIEVQCFTANEYVASHCWGVGCDHGSANEWEKEHGYYDSTGLWHGESQCGQASNQVIKDYDGDTVADKMIETGTDGLGNLPCTIWTDNTYTEERDIGTVKIGDYIYWTTSAGTKTWHHMGKVFETVFGHPNRS